MEALKETSRTQLAAIIANGGRIDRLERRCCTNVEQALSP